MTIEELLESTEREANRIEKNLIAFSLSGQPDTAFAMIYVSNMEIKIEMLVKFNLISEARKRKLGAAIKSAKSAIESSRKEVA
jgi:hypothetical protein